MVVIIRSGDEHDPAFTPDAGDAGVAVPEYVVPDRLAPYLYRCEGFVEHDTAPIRRRELPLVGMPIILAFGSPYRLSLASDPSLPVQMSRHFVAGLHETYSTSESTGTNWTIQIDLTPIGAYRILELPLHEVTNRITAVDDVMGKMARQLVSNLESTSTWHERYGLVESFLIERLVMSRPEATGMTWAWRQLADAHGSIPIGPIAVELGWSHRHLIQRFREQIGMSPKKVARQLRFLRAVDLLTERPDRSIASIGEDAGYFDQAHFARDFREFTGLTPAAYRRDASAASQSLA